MGYGHPPLEPGGSNTHRGGFMRNSKGVRHILLVLVAAALVLPQAMVASPAVGQHGNATLDFEQIAIEYVRAHAAELGLDADDVAEIRVSASYTSQHNRVTHVYLRQQRGGIDVENANMTVNIDRHGVVLFIGNRFVSLPPPSGTVTLTAVEAAEAAASELGIKSGGEIQVLERSGGVTRAAELSKGGVSARKIPAKLVYAFDGADLVLAWNVEIEETDFDHWWSATVNAETGELLSKYDFVDHDNAGQVAMSLASNKGISASTFAPAPGKGTGVGDGSSYNVYEHPKESPLDGPRTIVDDPAHFIASPYGWHDTDKAAGPEFTVTRGNNVHAYTDHNNDGVPDPGSDPDGGPGLDFSHPVDLTQHPHTYSDAAVTNLFYWNNIIHDLTHEYGFTEEAGNFQVNNYGRGGLGGDDVRAEAQDGGGMNNANFSTGAEGSRPRMQMYLWQHSRPNRVTIDPPSSAAGTYQASFAEFGPEVTLAGTSGSIALVNDGVATPPAGTVTDACEPLVGFPSGSIALLDRGSCNFTVKVKNAQNAGAIAAIVANNVPGNPGSMGGDDATITIPSVMVSLDAGNTIKAGLPATGTISADPARSVNRDGDFDAGIIAHEYGHGISNRLTGGPATTGCLSGQEQMGEGWSDFMAVVLTGMASDDRENRGVGNYALYNDVGRSGPGIRPTPYSTNTSINPATYDTIKTAAVPHGVGYVWNTMLWEVYWNLIDKHGFNPDLYDETGGGGNVLTLQLVMDGMKFQACRPGFVDGRDAILAADQALTNGDNQCEIWAGFAKRGLGFSAIQGSSASRSDGTQAFDTHPDCAAVAEVDPDSISRSVREGNIANTNLRIINASARHADDLTWEITETASDCATPSDLTWVTLSETSGTIRGGRHENVRVRFNSSGITAPATMTGKLCLATNDATNPVIEIPLTFEVRNF
jgi:extracellular elastinolytic metalloproteinase